MSREIDALVGEKVMGYGDRVKMFASGPVINDAYPVAVPFYSTDPGTAQEMLEERFGVGFISIDNGWRTEPRTREWTCKIVAPGEEGEATAPTFAMACCLAALAALAAAEKGVG